MDEKLKRLLELHRAALDADARFSAELERVYGARAGDFRYSSSHSDPGVIAAKEAKLKADADWAKAIPLQAVISTGGGS